MRIYFIEACKRCAVYAASEAEAIQMVEAQITFTKSDFEVQEGEFAPEEGSIVPISKGLSNPFGFSVDQLDRMLRTYPGVDEALLAHTDFPIVPELEPSFSEFFEVLDSLSNDPKSVDWKMKNYLFLRFPKLRDIVISDHKEKHLG